MVTISEIGNRVLMMLLTAAVEDEDCREVEQILSAYVNVEGINLDSILDMALTKHNNIAIAELLLEHASAHRCVDD